jgi:hypothetical protein
MLWLIKGLLVAMKSRRGRRLVFLGVTGAVKLAQSERARVAYARAWSVATDERPRRKARAAARRVGAKVKRTRPAGKAAARRKDGAAR